MHSFVRIVIQGMENVKKITFYIKLSLFSLLFTSINPAVDYVIDRRFGLFDVGPGRREELRRKHM